MAKAPDILYLLRTQHENLGDLLINRFLLKFLGEIGCSVVVDDYGVPMEFLESAVEGNATIRKLSALSPNRVKSLSFLMAGSASRNIPKIVLIPPGHQTPKSSKAFFERYLMYSFFSLLKLRGFRFVQFGISTESNGWLERMRRRLASMAIDRLGYRDPVSFELAGGIGVLHDDLILLAHEKVQGASVENLGRLVLSYRWDHYTHTERHDVIDRVVNMVTEIVRLRLPLRITVSSQVERDAAASVALSRALQERLKINVEMRVVKSWEDACSTYGQGAFVCSNRLHVSLTALVIGGLGCATVDKRLDSKILGAFAQVGMSDYTCSIGDLPRVFVDATSRSREAARSELTRINNQLAHRSSSLKTVLAQTILSPGMVCSI